MKLVTFVINEGRNLRVLFPVFIQPYLQHQLILYQIEMIPVPIIDQTKQAHSYTHLQVDRPYIPLDSEKSISLRHQELRLCKNIGYEFNCEELFVVKHKSKYNCESAIYFNLGSEIFKENGNFAYYFNKTDIKPAVLMVDMKLFWQTEPTLNILNVILIMIFNSYDLAYLMF